jgi:predicted 3-demethylubiquinone-9 3-methyltransferase (glyoxalase superfamily)
MPSQKITPCLWFDHQAEEAAELYTSIFDNSRISRVNRYGEAAAKAAGRPKGSALTVTFEIEGQELTGLNGGPHFKLNQAVSFYVSCESVQEVDRLWERLSPGGQVRMQLSKYPFSERYGWIEDRFGVSWQLNLDPSGSKQKIKPLLMFSGAQWGKAEEAITFYTSVFKNSRITKMVRYDKNFPGPEGKVVHSAFSLDGQELMAMDSHTDLPIDFSPAISFFVNCQTQAEIDEYWKALSAHEEAEQCGWLRDKFGLSWQIVPSILGELLSGPDPTQSENVMKALLQMKKLDVEELQNAAAR